MKLNVLPRQNLDPDTARWYMEIARQVNALSEGSIAGAYTARTAAPSSGTFAKGDFIRNSAPAEAGTAGSKYVITGFLCVAAGSPGTWVQCRSLTGN